MKQHDVLEFDYLVYSSCVEPLVLALYQFCLIT